MSTPDEIIASAQVPISLSEDCFIGRIPNFDLIFEKFFPNLNSFVTENGTASTIGKGTYVFRLKDGRALYLKFNGNAIEQLGFHKSM